MTIGFPTTGMPWQDALGCRHPGRYFRRLGKTHGRREYPVAEHGHGECERHAEDGHDDVHRTQTEAEMSPPPGGR